MELVFRIASWLGTVASIAGFLYVFAPPGGSLTPGQTAFLVLTLVFIFLVIIFDIRAFLLTQPRSYSSSVFINAYLYDWIDKGGRVVIFTRDMSWANDSVPTWPRLQRLLSHLPFLRITFRQKELKSLLIKKAQAGDLRICLPTMIPLAKELQQAGADVFCYEALNYLQPESRFTIINWGRMDMHVAVGRRVNNKHVIEEFSVGQHPVFSVAKDLVEILSRLPPAK